MLRFVIAVTLSAIASVWADDNVRGVQEKLRDGGFYSGEIDGAYSTDLSAALSRYQTHNGLPITGQLDVETSEALGAKPAVGPSTPATEQSNSETWRRLRRGGGRTSTARRSETNATEEREGSPVAGETEGSTHIEPRSAPAATAGTSSDETEPASSPPAAAGTSQQTTEERAERNTEEPPRSAPAATATPPATDSGGDFSLARVRDYIAAFVLAGLDKNVGAEIEFFADRVDYYDSSLVNRENIREDLKRYDERWPERHFWFAGKITVEPESDNRVRATFPLGFKLRNGNKTVTGKVNKSLVLEGAGDDLQIVAVNERKAE